jgi:hypothetical protein
MEFPAANNILKKCRSISAAQQIGLYTFTAYGTINVDHLFQVFLRRSCQPPVKAFGVSATSSSM